MIICPHCGKEFDEKAKPQGKWYFTNKWVIIAFLCVGPFALPLVCFNPNYKPLTKWIVSILVLAATFILIVLSAILIGILIEQFKALTELM